MDYARHVIANVVPPEKGGKVIPIDQVIANRAMDALLGRVESKTFPPPYDEFFRLYSDYFLQHGGQVPDYEVFADLASKAKLPKEIQPTELCAIYRDAADLVSSKEKYEHALEGLTEEAAVRDWGETLTQGMELLTKGKKLDGAWQQGYRSSHEYVLKAATALPRTTVQVPETNARDSASLREAYERAKTTPLGAESVLSGWDYFDQATGGGQRGEVMIIGAHTGDGKSVTMTAHGVNSCTKFGKNVVYGSAEMHPHIVKRRVYANHSHHPKFKLPNGVRLNDLKFGRLSAAQEQIFWQQVVPDFEQNPDYGRFEIFMIPKGASIEWVNARVMRYRAQFPVDMLIIDYLSLLAPERRRATEREELSDTMQGAKQLALNFNNGEGLFLLTAFQTSRREYEKALEQGRYSISAFAGSAEAENSADIAAWTLRTPETIQQHEMLWGFVKLRDGEIPPETRFYEAFESAYIGELCM